MIIEICVGVLTAAFVALVIYLIITLRSTTAALKKTNHLLSRAERDIDEITGEGVKLVKNLNELTVDIRKKSEALNVLIHPFEKQHRGRSERKHEDDDDTGSSIGDLIEYVTTGIVLFNKIKGDIKHYVKSR